MNIYDYEPLERLEICMLLATLDNLDFTNISPEVEGLLVEFEEAGIITPDNTLVGRGQVDLTSKGRLFKKRAMRWLKTQGKLGLVELAILEKIVSGQNTDVNSWDPIETELGEATLAEIKKAIAELENSGLIKSSAIMEAELPISLIGLNGYQYTLHTKNPPAWQHEKKYSNMTTNNNISIGNHATVGVAGTNSGIAVTGSSIMLSPDQIQSIHTNIDKLQSEIEKDELVPTEASKAIGGILTDAKNKITNTTKEEAKKILEDTAQEATDSARNYLKGMVLEGVSALLGTLPAFIQSLPM
ncbi:hypothetical protein [Rothia aeria]|jgi:hypothetical protein|uniref:hypothetical protein n=1 Tax=Rothia aeria TaxID=172042 RepID=UPI00254AD7A3|nr:hypothetical protein [Rothia aeria]MDK7677935.1 hypothetical protein [Rothia aeria]